MADTGAPFEIPYVEPTDLVRTYPAASELLADAIADQFGLGYQYVGTRYYTSSGTFAKADPFGDSSFDGAKMRGVRVRMVGGGGGGAGGGATGAGFVDGGSGGGGGGFSEKFYGPTDIAGFSASETVTRGAGGAGGTGGTVGSVGGASTFNGMTANGGSGGTLGGGAAPIGVRNNGGAGGTATGGDLNISGEKGEAINYVFTTNSVTTLGGSSALGAGAGSIVRVPGGNGGAGQAFGGGGGGGVNGQNSASACNGGAGAAGIVIIDVFA